MERMTIHEIAQAAHGIVNIETQLTVGDICTDTRKIKPGCLYVALKGERFDGHDFIEKAFELGAAAAVSEKVVHTDHPVILVKDTRIALGKMASYYRDQFSLPLIGVTGSVGKTSTKEMIASVLGEKFCVHKTQGNFNNDIGLPMTLFGLNCEHTAAVIEMGMSHLGEIRYLSDLAKPTMAVITNIGVSHLENLGTRENILKAKLEILEGMAQDAPIILNADNDMLATVRETLGHRAVWFGIEHTDGMVYAEEIHQSGEKTTFHFVYQGQRYPAVLPAIGIHNVYNALAGFAVGIMCGLTPEQIVRGVRRFENSGMRQKIHEYNGIKVIADCYNASPDSMQSALSVIGTVDCTGKRVAVLGDMLELGEQSSKLHYDVGQQAAISGIDELLCFGSEAVHIADGAKAAGFGHVLYFQTAEDVILYIKENLRLGDAIIFKASRGMKFEQLIDGAFGSMDTTGF
jgi:UDP-N-acetylmuramoyl-tripeptide--D-alanyl-D-alanine ligase